MRTTKVETLDYTGPVHQVDEVELDFCPTCSWEIGSCVCGPKDDLGPITENDNVEKFHLDYFYVPDKQDLKSPDAYKSWHEQFEKIEQLKHPYPGISLYNHQFLNPPPSDLIEPTIQAYHFIYKGAPFCNKQVHPHCGSIPLSEENVAAIKNGTPLIFPEVPKSLKPVGAYSAFHLLNPTLKNTHFELEDGSATFCNVKGQCCLKAKDVVKLTPGVLASYEEKEAKDVTVTDEEVEQCEHDCDVEECGSDHCQDCGDDGICSWCYEGQCADCCGITHCPGCGADLDDDGCDHATDYCVSCCGCNYCESCEQHLGIGPDSDVWCSSCCMCTSCGCSCEGGSDGDGFGSMEQTPWEARGIEVVIAEIEVKYDNQGWFDGWKKTWGFDPNETDVVQMMCDFYVLEGVANMVFNAIPEVRACERCQRIAGEAKVLLDERISTLDDIFQKYVDMVVGGELRHHKAVKHNQLHPDRQVAWVQWQDVRRTLGVEALADAMTLFRDFGDNGFGGKAWADCTEILYNRLTGKFDPLTFIDRVFNAQHNGGSLLNKVGWATTNAGGWNYGHISHKNGLGDAHAADPPRFGPLLLAASPVTRRLFSRWWNVTNSVRARHGVEVTEAPTWRSEGKLAAGYIAYPGDFLYVYLDFQLYHGLGLIDKEWKPTFGGDIDEINRRMKARFGEKTPKAKKKPVNDAYKETIKTALLAQSDQMLKDAWKAPIKIVNSSAASLTYTMNISTTSSSNEPW